MKPFKQRCEEECTRDVIFLFQRRRRVYHTLPDGIGMCDGEFVGANGTGYTKEHVLQLCAQDENYVEWWDTESVWLDRETAEAYGQAHAYNYSDGWRVYGVPAEDRLAGLIRDT
jgi:hypothetical protein